MEYNTLGDNKKALELLWVICVVTEYMRGLWRWRITLAGVVHCERDKRSVLRVLWMQEALWVICVVTK